MEKNIKTKPKVKPKRNASIVKIQRINAKHHTSPLQYKKHIYSQKINILLKYAVLILKNNSTLNFKGSFTIF